MTKDIVPELRALLDAAVVTTGSFSKTFTYLPWGRHYNTQDVAVGYGIISAVEVGHPKRVSDMGGGAQQGHQVIDIHVFWEDDDLLTTPALFEAFRKAVKTKVETIIRTNEKSFIDSFYVQVTNDNNQDALLGPGVAPMKNEHVLTIEASTVDVYG